MLQIKKYFSSKQKKSYMCTFNGKSNKNLRKNAYFVKKIANRVQLCFAHKNYCATFGIEQT